MEERKEKLKELRSQSTFVSREAEMLMSAKTQDEIKASLDRIDAFLLESKEYLELMERRKQLEESLNNLKLNDVTRADLVDHMQIFQKEIDGLIQQVKIEIEKDSNCGCSCENKKKENPDEAAKAAKAAEIFKLLKELGVKSFHVEFE